MLLLGSAGKGILMGELSGVCQMCCLRGGLCKGTQELSWGIGDCTQACWL